MAAEADNVCAQEPIHILGHVQPHGALLVIDTTPDATVVAASHNSVAFFGGTLNGPIVGRKIIDLLGPDIAATLHTRLRENRLRGEMPWQFTLRRGSLPQALHATVHQHAGNIIIEFEQAGRDDAADVLIPMHQLQEAIVSLRATDGDLDALAHVAARHIRMISGYERVLIYRFDADWSGQAIAEDKIDSWAQSMDGLHFPAADIPAQARKLYRHSPMRWVPDRDAKNISIDMAPALVLQSQGAPAIDLTFAHLRALSPVHMQYHSNMGVNGSLSVSILHNKDLWGLVIGHHRQPHYLSMEQRAAIATLTEVFALRVGFSERSEIETARNIQLLRLSDLLLHMAEAEDVATALTTGKVTIADLFASSGAALLNGGAISLLGITPPEVDVRALADWLRLQDTAAKSYQTNHLSAAFPAWERYAEVASGVLAVYLSDDREDMLLWFRNEPVATHWGGNPTKDAAGGAFLPRQSFERWVETKRGFSLPWADWELQIAETLRHSIMEVIVRRLKRIADLNEKLRQSQKMEAVGQLTGGLAHDFNNLLTGIIGSLDIIGDRIAQGRQQEVAQFLDAAKSSANRAASLTHRLLTFSRRQTLDPKPVDIDRLAASMEDLIRRTVGPAIHVTTMMAADLWHTICDANQLENALLNLAINGRDAMPQGGRLTIEARNITLDNSFPRQTHDMLPGHYVAISVSDTGVGMADDVVARVFEPFFTTKPMGQGTGLGLSMVYGFAKQSNGHTSIYSEVGRGTSVRLYLPRYLGTDQAQAVLSPLIAADATSHKGETVLVVDDEEIIRMLISEVLGDLGYKVIEAADGVAGLGILQTTQHLDLMVTDVGLPGGVNGRQLADAARVTRPGLKVLFITGFAENAALGGGILEAGMEVMTKPFALDVLAAKIRAMM